MIKDLNKIKNKILPVLKRHNVSKSSLFGSFVRGDAKRNSDIDILVKLPPGSSLLDLVGLKIELVEKMGRKVDVLTFNSVSHLLKKEIKKNQLSIL
jgi:predicted nucleotidyltransferase